MLTSGRYLVNGSPISPFAARFAASNSIVAVATLNLGGRLPATTFARSFAPTTLTKRALPKASCHLAR